MGLDGAQAMGRDRRVARDGVGEEHKGIAAPSSAAVLGREGAGDRGEGSHALT